MTVQQEIRDHHDELAQLCSGLTSLEQPTFINSQQAHCDDLESYCQIDPTRTSILFTIGPHPMHVSVVPNRNDKWDVQVGSI